MSRKLVVAAMAALCVASMVGAAAADIIDPTKCTCTVLFRRTYGSNSQLVGQPVSYVTIAPDNTGETFFNANGVAEPDGLADIDIQITLRNSANQPIAGIPAQEVVLFNAAMAFCPGGNISDAGTDINGVARFTLSMAAGGCVNSLEVWADGQQICTLNSGGVTVKTNSPDYAHQGTSPGGVDQSDVSFFAAQLGKAAAGRICSDFNEQGLPNIDSSDLAVFASYIGATCQ